jgi:glyoxylase-like metal-dependent hydrolase (beta-lactamase superfamily II)
MDPIHTFRLGDFTVSVISEGTLSGDPEDVFRGLDPAVWRPIVALDEAGRLVFGLNLILVQAGGRVVLLDTGIGEPTAARDRFEASFPFSPHLPLLSALDKLRVPPETVTDVIFSHVHADHIMGATVERGGRRVPAFPNATHLMRREDGGRVPERPDRRANYDLHIPVLSDRGIFVLLDEDREVAPGISIVHAPGESPGHVIVRLESRGNVAYYVGDLFHDACEAEHVDFVWPGRDPVSMVASRRALIARALAEDALLLAAHTPFPGAARLHRTQSGVAWRPVPP